MTSIDYIAGDDLEPWLSELSLILIDVYILTFVSHSECGPDIATILNTQRVLHTFLNVMLVVVCPYDAYTTKKLLLS